MVLKMGVMDMRVGMLLGRLLMGRRLGKMGIGGMRMLLPRRLVRCRCWQRGRSLKMRTWMSVRMKVRLRLAMAKRRGRNIEALHIVRARLRLPRLVLVSMMLKGRAEVDGRGAAHGWSGPRVGGGRRVGRAHLLGRSMR